MLFNSISNNCSHYRDVRFAHQGAKMRITKEDVLQRAEPLAADVAPDGAGIASIVPVTLRHVLREAARQGLDTADLCQGLGFSAPDLESEGFGVSSAQCVWVIRRVLHQLQRPTLGLQLGAAVNVVSWGPVSLGYMASATSRELLDFAIVFQHAAGRLPTLRGETLNESFRLIAQAHFHDRDVAAFLVDETFAALVQICRQVVGPHFNPQQVDLVIERPVHGAVYEDVFRCPVRFGRAENRVYFPAEPYAVRTADRLALQQVARWLTPEGEARPEPSELESAVIQAIRRDLAHPMPLSDIAASLNISERTLRRRLVGLGYSYAALLNEERKSRALSLITHSTRTIHEIALECGFADGRTLQRAIKRWTGYSPTGFRQQSRPGPDSLRGAAS
jgi:AraC-like DNA-binding protein